MGAVFIDTNVPMYAIGRAHPLQGPAVRVLRGIGRGDLDSVTDVEVLQEILHRYIHIGERRLALLLFDRFHQVMAGRIKSVLVKDAVTARHSAEEHPHLNARDLIHLAVMRRLGINTIITADRDFEGISGLTRLDLASF